MKQFLKRVKQISIFILAISIIGCDNDDDQLPEIIPGFTQTIDETTGKVTFINISENSSSYLWAFGDGTTSTEINPIRTFLPGTYKVILRATNADGTFAIFEDIIIIPGEAPPTDAGDGEEFDSGLLINGDFEDGTTAWSGNALNIVTEGGNSFSLANVETADSGQPFLANLSQVVELTQGATYILTFDASSDRARTIIAGIGLNVEPFTNNTETINLTTATQTFTFEFTATDFGGPDSRVLFDLAAEVGTVVIDNVSLFLDENGNNGDCTADAAQSLSASDFSLTFQTDPTASISSFDVGFSWVNNPDVDAMNNGSCKVGQIDRNASGMFANNQIALDSKLNFSDNAGFKMKVWSPTAGTNVLLKLEDQNDPGTLIEVPATTTKGGEWEELTFPLANTENGKFDLIILFFEVNTNTTETYYIDDLVLEPREVGPEGDNLVKNGGFETGNAGDWNTDVAGNSGTFNVSSTMPACGAYSANLVADSAQLYLISQNGIGIGMVQPNSNIVVSFDLRGSQAGDGGVFIAELFSESSTSGVTKSEILSGAPITPLGEWTRYSFPVTTGPDVSAGLTLLLKAECGAVDGCAVDISIDNVFIGIGDVSNPQCTVTNGMPSLSIVDVTVDEANGTATFSVGLGGAEVSGGFTVDYATADGSAVQPDDYTATSGTLSFAGTNGELQDIVVPIIDDALEEAQENFVVNLTNVSNSAVELSSASATGNINDNDGETTELSENGGFENGTLEGWAVYDNGGSITLDNTDPSSGTWSATLVATPTGQNPTLKQERKGAGTLSVGDTVQITFDYKGSLSGVGGVYSFQSFVEAADGVNQTENFSVTPTNTWQTFSATYSVGSGDISGGITMEFVAICGADPGTNCVSTLSVDNVSVVINP